MSNAATLPITTSATTSTPSKGLHIGVVELLGALGLILPAATRIMPKLTPLAASGLLTVMVLASMTHISRGEYPMIVANLVLGGLAAFIAWGRFKKAPISARN